MISRTEFERTVSPQNIRVSQVIHIVLPLGALLFLGVIVLIHSGSSVEFGPDEEIIRLLSHILLGMAATVYVLAPLLYGKFVQSISLERPVRAKGVSYTLAADIFVAGLRTAQILRLALLEGVAYFGLVVCFLAVQSGLVEVEPLYWATTIPTFVVTAVAGITFPTKERIADQFESLQSAGVI